MSRGEHLSGKHWVLLLLLLIPILIPVIPLFPTRTLPPQERCGKAEGGQEISPGGEGEGEEGEGGCAPAPPGFQQVSRKGGRSRSIPRPATSEQGALPAHPQGEGDACCQGGQGEQGEASTRGAGDALWTGEGGRSC